MRCLLRRLRARICARVQGGSHGEALQYDGEWVQGKRQGQGSCWYYNGEVRTLGIPRLRRASVHVCARSCWLM